MKRIRKTLLIVILAVAAPAFTGCTDYQDEIDALDKLSKAKWQETLNKLEEPDEGIFGGLKLWYNTKAQGYDTLPCPSRKPKD